MCGLTGYFNFKNNKLTSADILKDMIGNLYHRGPDESGIYLDDYIGLGHTRLSIIDLQSGQQPMSTIDERYWIVYNGEIFNYVELKEELRAKGYRFRTTSDTEVLLNMFAEMGASCLGKLNGQFSFAIWDTIDKELFLARDRVGIRPLFFTDIRGTFIFGSEIKAILEHPDINLQFSPYALSEIFTFWTTLSPNTAFKDIYELPPGHYMRVDEKGIHISKYWSLNFPEDGLHSRITFDEAKEEFDALFADAVKIRMRADVPVGAYLSGGIDSSTTTSYMRDQIPNNLKSFSIRFEDSEFDESYYQDLAINHLGTNHSKIYCGAKDIADVFPEVIWHTEMPLMRTAPAPMFLLSQHVKNNKFKVVVTGEGADEILAGYNIFKEMLIRRFWAKDPKSKYRPLLLKKLYPYLSHIQKQNPNFLKLFFGFQLSNTNSPVYSHLLRWNNSSRIKNYFSDQYRELTVNYNPIESITRNLPDRFDKLNHLSQAQWIETNIFMSGYLLSSQGDRMAMANSVEGRYPFLDYRIIEFCSKLNPDYKLDGLNEKKLLKELMNKKLPKQIIDRPKQAYRAPMASSFLKSIPIYLHETISEDTINNIGIFSSRSINDLIKKLKSGYHISEVDNMTFTAVISTHLLYKQFISKDYTEYNVYPRQILHPKVINKQALTIESRPINTQK